MSTSTASTWTRRHGVLHASAVMNPKYFSGIFRGVGKNIIAEMQEHSGLAWWKSNGNYEIGTGASMKSMIIGMQDSARETVSEKLGAPAGMADDIGWACIWQAVKHETEAEHPNIEVGGEAYWNIVRSRFEDVCLRTQVVDTVLTRSQLMRSKSQLMKSVTAFMSEPTKNYNLIRNAVSDMAGLPASGLIADTELKKRPWQHWYKLPGCAYEAKDSGRAQGRRKRSIRIPSR